MLTPSSIQIAWLSLVKWPILRLDTAITKCLKKNIKINLTFIFQWTSGNMCQFDKKIGLPLKMQIFTNHFVLRRQPAEFSFVKKNRKFKQASKRNFVMEGAKIHLNNPVKILQFTDFSIFDTNHHRRRPNYRPHDSCH